MTIDNFYDDDSDSINLDVGFLNEKKLTTPDSIQHDLLSHLKKVGASESEILHWTTVVEECNKICMTFKDKPALMTFKILNALIFSSVMGYCFGSSTLASANNANFTNNLKYSATAVSTIVNAYLSGETAAAIVDKIASQTRVVCEIATAGKLLGLFTVLFFSCINSLPVYSTYLIDSKAVHSYLDGSEWAVFACRTILIANSSVDFASRLFSAIETSPTQKLKNELELYYDAFNYKVQTLIAQADSITCSIHTRENAHRELTKIAHNIYDAFAGEALDWTVFYDTMKSHSVPLSYRTGNNTLDRALLWARENKTSAVIHFMTVFGAGFLAYYYADSMFTLTQLTLNGFLSKWGIENSMDIATTLARLSEATMMIFAFDWIMRGAPLLIDNISKALIQWSEVFKATAMCKISAKDFMNPIYNTLKLFIACSIITLTSFASSEFARLSQKPESEIIEGAAAGAGMNANSSLRISSFITGLVLTTLTNFIFFFAKYCVQSLLDTSTTHTDTRVGSWILRVARQSKEASHDIGETLQSLKSTEITLDEHQPPTQTAITVASDSSIYAKLQNTVRTLSACWETTEATEVRRGSGISLPFIDGNAA